MLFIVPVMAMAETLHCASYGVNQWPLLPFSPDERSRKESFEREMGDVGVGEECKGVGLGDYDRRRGRGECWGQIPFRMICLDKMEEEDMGKVADR